MLESNLLINLESDAETRYWATQAALLDPRAYQLAISADATLDVTVPADRAWYTIQLFQVRINEPVVVVPPPQTGAPYERRSGFLRPLDARRPLALPAGTRLRAIPGQNGSHVYYCDPASVWEIDERYRASAKALYFERLARLETIPLNEIIVEVSGGNSLNDDTKAPIPSFEMGMLVNVSVYDACWLNWGIMNVMSEVNNTHTVRFAESLLCPFMRNRIGGDYFVVKKGSYSDTPDSTNPAITQPRKGSGNAVYAVLPADW